MGFKKNKVKNTFSRQDENWELMTIIGVPWTECDKISDEDRNTTSITSIWSITKVS